jgi:hypothetical protein
LQLCAIPEEVDTISSQAVATVLVCAVIISELLALCSETTFKILAEEAT